MVDNSDLPEAASSGRPRSTEVDEAILAEATQLFIEGGFAAVTFEQISRRSGVSRPAIYRRWNSREELLAFALGRLRENTERGFANWKKKPLDEILDWMVKETPKAMLNPLYGRLTAQAMALGLDAPALREVYWEAFLKPRRDAFSAMIFKAQSEGHVSSAISPELIQDMLHGALLNRMLLDPATLTEARLRAYLVELLVALGLRKRTGSGKKK